MKLQIFKKYFLTAAVIILISLAIMMLIMTFVFNRYMADSNYDSLKKTCHTVADFCSQVSAEDLPEKEAKRNIYYTMNSIAGADGIDILITDPYGKVLLCSCEKWDEKGSCSHSKTPISSAFTKKVCREDVSKPDTLGIYRHPRYVSAVALRGDDGSFGGTVIATASMSVLRSLIRSMMRIYLVSAIIPLGIMFIALYVMTYRLTKPMKQMSQAAKAMARGDFSRRIPVTSNDEIGELALSFNQMTNSLVQLEEMRRSFVANVSHELKTPMTTIGGFIDGIIDGTIEPEKQGYYLEIVSGEVKRLSRLVQSMLNIAKIESGEFTLRREAFNFRETLLNIVINQEQRINEKSVSVEGLDILPDVTLTADRDLIYQAVYNLVDNAVKFTEPGGEIRFELTADGKRMCFRVTNTGKGIPEKSLPYVFERFYKVDKSRSANKNSTGLGLYLVKTIVKTHGGKISVESRENEYTTFEILLPLAKQEEFA